MRTDPAGGRPMALHDATSFEAGRSCGARVAACVARLAAIELMEDARWWNRWRRRLMAGALVAHAAEMESAVDADAPAETREAASAR